MSLRSTAERSHTNGGTSSSSPHWRENPVPTDLMLSRAQRARVEARTASAVPRPIPRHDRVPRPARDEGHWGPPLHPTPPHRHTGVEILFPHQPHAERPEGPVEARTASAVPRPIPRHDRVPRPARDEGRWGSPLQLASSPHLRENPVPTNLMLSGPKGLSKHARPGPCPGPSLDTTASRGRSG